MAEGRVGVKTRKKGLCLDRFWDRILEQSHYNELAKEHNLYLCTIFFNCLLSPEELFHRKSLVNLLPSWGIRSGLDTSAVGTD